MAGAGGLTPTALADAVRQDLPLGPRVIALSGGADSAACAWAAARDDAYPLRSLHVHHGLEASDLMAEAAAEVAKALGIDLDQIDVAVPDGPSPENQARRVRHEALESALKPDEFLLSGHTRDDQAETVLANLLRGSGARGLSGIPRRRGRWVRPLLGIARADVRHVADELGLPYVDDPANSDPRPLRNRLRHDLIPSLEELSPAVKTLLAGTAELLSYDDELLEARAALVPVVPIEGGVKLPATMLTSLPGPIAARAVRGGLRSARGPHAGTAEEVGVLLAVAAGASAGATIGEGLLASREGPWLVVAGEPEVPSPVEIALPGLTEFWAGRIHTELLSSPPRPRPIGRYAAILDVGAVGDSPTLRSAQPGERIAIGEGHKRVVAAMAEAGVPRRLRASWPVLDVGGNIAWLVGVRVAPWAVAGEATSRWLAAQAQLEER